MSAALNASNLYRFYHVGDDEVFALRGVSITLEPGEFVAVVGPSGSGKSTLFNCLAGLDDPVGGHIELGGRLITRRPEAERAQLRATGIGVLLQRRNLFPHLTVLENVTLRQMAGRKRRMHDPVQMLREVGLASRAGAMPATLSGGEAARAGLAVAMAVDPPVLLCDEPTAEVDQATETTIVALLKSKQRDGTAILVATHSATLAGKADRVLHLVEGAFV